MNDRSKEIWLAHSNIQSIYFDYDEKKIFIHVRDVDNTKIVIDNLEEDLDSVKKVLIKNAFPCVIIEIVNVSSVPIDADGLP